MQRSPEQTERNPSLKSRLLARLAASRFLTTSLVIHIALVGLLGSVVIFQAAREHPAFSAVGQASFLQEQGEPEIAQEQVQEFREFEEPAPASPSSAAALPATSIIGAMTDTPSSWSTPISFDTMSTGPGLADPLAAPPSGKHGAAGGKLRSLGKASSFSFMGVRSESRRVVFLLDASGSMVLDSKGGGEAYEDLKRKLVELVQGLDSTTQFNVIMFGDGGVDLFQNEAVSATDDKVVELREWIEPYMRGKSGLLRQTYTKSRLGGTWGTTRLDVALTAALEMESETLFILTDGTPSVIRAASAEDLKKWEANKEKNKALFERYEKEVKEFEAKNHDAIEKAKQKAAELNKAVTGRAKEHYNWHDFAPAPPPAPPGYYRPTGRVTADDFNAMLKTLYQEIYAPKKMQMPTVNIVGYYVNDDAEDYLKAMTKGIPGKFKAFKDKKN